MVRFRRLLLIIFVQGILSAREMDLDQEEESSESAMDTWLGACAAILYAAIQHISAPCWRKIVGRSGSRLTAALGIVAVVCFMVLAAFQQPPYGNLIYGLGAGAGVALVHLYLKHLGSLAGDQAVPLWDMGVVGVGLAFWPLLGCVFISSNGPGLALLPLAAAALHALPITLLLNSSEKLNDQNELKENRGANLDLTHGDVEKAANGPFVRTGGERLSNMYLSNDQSLFFYRVKLRYMVCDVLPGIPEEDEYEQEEEIIACHRHVLQRRSIDEINKYTDENSNLQGNYLVENSPEVITSHKAHRISLCRLNYPLLSVITLFRLGNDTCLTAVIFFLPIYSNYVEAHMPIQEKAFLLSIFGFSMILAEFSILWFITRGNCVSSSLCSVIAKERNRKISGFPIFISIAPLISTFGLFLIWKSKNHDAITVAGLVLGIGSGSCAIILRLLEKKVSSGICQDFTDVAAGVALIGFLPLVKILILKNAIVGYFLFAAGIYILTSLVSLIALR
ncbi:uncharacterized protein LOC107267617 isoform X2 [Cephus cinctus]|uniref:Uncharacterized protein LOC107267617 isoform X2 n=1 Tax=Cephus cinctus TaxID=211228 RepID=A0AAJ7RHS9_CEPCN|nr:uncharacterized protein LOC107267617 isoform X2 [Cephus cinctus]